MVADITHSERAHTTWYVRLLISKRGLANIQQPNDEKEQCRLDLVLVAIFKRQHITNPGSTTIFIG
jgi:hypothetical protein